MSVIQNFLLATPEGYQISRSVRLRSSASAYFNRTPASAGNRKTWTWSGWVKRGALGGYQDLICAGSGGSDRTLLGFTSSNVLEFYSAQTTQTAGYTTNAVYRDPSAWYHIVLALDTTQSVAADRVRIWVNGVLQTLTVAWTIAQNADLYVNTTTIHALGRESYTAGNFFDGYLTEINFIDGQALTPSSFGETDAVTGVWKPKKYAGTYGTNGFYLNFADPSAATAAAIGKDNSGNGNNWTPNNISVTAGVTYDSMLDVPTPWADGGNGRGNYATWNPLNVVQSTLTQGNLLSSATGSSTNVVSTFPTATTGKWYAEIVLSFSVNINWPINIGASDGIGGNTYCRLYTDWSSRAIFKSINGTTSSVTPSGAFPANNDILKIAYDADAGQLWLGLNGNWYGTSGSLTGDPATGTDATLSGIAGKQIYPNHANAGGPAQNAYLNCGQRPFAYTPPTGFKALNTQNLPTPTILKGNQYFDVRTRAGTSTTTTISGYAFTPDLVWIKIRSGNERHVINDTVRGALKQLASNSTAAEDTSTTGALTAFTADGYSLDSDLSRGSVNNAAYTYVDWVWSEGAQAGFDIVTWTGTGAAQNISHNLGVAPSMIIWKYRSSTSDWAVGHKLMNGGTNPWNYWAALNTTAAQAASSGPFNNTAPTSSQFTVGSFNANGVNMVAYLFAEVSQFSKAFSFTGNGSTDGVFVFTGFLPRLILLKRTDTTGNWIMWDTARNTYNVLGEELYPNLSNAAASATDLDVLSNGFKLRNSTAAFNASGGTYIGFAWAANPFKYSLGF